MGSVVDVKLVQDFENASTEAMDAHLSGFGDGSWSNSDGTNVNIVAIRRKGNGRQVGLQQSRPSETESLESAEELEGWMVPYTQLLRRSTLTYRRRLGPTTSDVSSLARRNL